MKHTETNYLPYIVKSILVFAVLLLLDLSLGATVNQGNITSSDRLSANFTGENTSVTIELEVADTRLERQKGLMFRKDLPSNSGMLFVFSKEKDLEFWMKNTYIPLDIIFLDSSMSVVNIEHAHPPLNTTDRQFKLYRSNEPSQYVVEMKQGFAKNYSIKPGDRLVIN